MHPLLAASLANTLSSDRVAAAKTRRAAKAAGADSSTPRRSRGRRGVLSPRTS
jgi:hypothetical protein